MKAELAERRQRECLILQEMREIRRQEEQELEETDRLRELQYAREIDQRAVEERRVREERKEARERILTEVARMIVEAETQKRRRQEVIAELVAEDIECGLAMREREEVARRKRMKEELAVALEEQIIFTERCKLRFVERDREFAEEIMRKIMEDERMARLTTEARRRMQLQYRQDLQELIEERRRIREKEIARIEEAANEERRREEARKDRVREERKRLLEQHASNVGSFVNKGALTAEEQEIVAQFLKDQNDGKSPGKS